MKSRARSCRDAARHLPPEARPEAHAGAVRRQGGGDALRFVVQRHAARSLHYDFRLERDGVLLSWAVPKGVPLALGERHLAVHVEDHPLDYGDFEGEIPAGQYGAGTVEIWDRGTYELVEEKKDGGLTVRLHGSRLDGLWTLVPAHLDGKEKNWLLLRKDEGSEEPRLRADARHRNRRPAGRRGLGVRAEVGRVQGPRARRRWRRHLPQPQRQRPHAPLRRGGPRRRPRGALALRGARRRDLRARRDRPLGVRVAPAGSRLARLRRLRRARGGRRAAHRPHLHRAARGARAAPRHVRRRRPRLSVVRRRGRARAGRARARARGRRRRS